MEGMSETLYVTLCHAVAFPTEVTINRDVADLRERISRLESLTSKRMVLQSGSIREGLSLPRSDVDFMYWPTDHKVICDYKQSDLYRSSNTTLIMMECCDIRPGFALLELLTETNNRYVKPACITMNDKIYISSSLYRESTLTFYQLQNYLHGPCASGRFRWGLEYDQAHCFSCDFWPPVASEFVERSRLKRWPSSNVLQDIIKSGCHVVAIGRRNSTQEHNEWRVSFSVAEQELVYSMNHCQFLCYGMMKIFLKEVLNNNLEEPLLCSYFVKTILFWEIQGHNNFNWTPQNILNCIWQCFKHLIKFVDKGECPNFFIPSNNMFYNKIVGSARARLLSQLYEQYEKGVSCLLQCPSIISIMETLVTHTEPAININESRWLSSANRDGALFKSIFSITNCPDNLYYCFNRLSVFEKIQETPLSVYQVLALQQCILATLVRTAFYLPNVPCRHRYIHRARYKIDKKICHMLNLVSKFGNISDILYMAMYYYLTVRYKQALYHVEEAKVKLSQACILFHKAPEARYNDAFNGIPLSARMREAFASHVKIYPGFIRELTLEIKVNEKAGLRCLLIPPYIIVSMLSVLCYRDNPRKQEEAINNLHTLLTHDDEIYFQSIYRNIAWQILGISQQIYGDWQSALNSYLEALKYTERQYHDIQEATKARIQNVQCSLEFYT